MIDDTDLPSYREEVAGWLVFVLFVLSIWRLRERLNRTAGDG